MLVAGNGSLSGYVCMYAYILHLLVCMGTDLQGTFLFDLTTKD